MDIANLVIAVDATQPAQAAGTLDQLSQAGARAQTAAGGLSRAHAQVAESVRRMTAEEYRAVQAIERFAQASSRLSSSSRAVTVSAGQMRSGMQQLGFQLNDIAQGFAMGVSPMTIFAQQGSQVIQSLQMMNRGGNAFLSFLGGPWGIGLTVAATALLPLIANLFDTRTAVERATDELIQNAQEAEVTRQAHEAFAASVPGIIASINSETDAIIAQNRTLEDNQRLRLATIGGGVAAATMLRPFVQAAAARAQGGSGLFSGAIARGYRQADDSMASAITTGQRGQRESLIPLMTSDVAGRIDRTTGSVARLNRELRRLQTDFASRPGNPTDAEQRAYESAAEPIQRQIAALQHHGGGRRGGGGGRTGRAANDNSARDAERNAEQRFRVGIETMQAEQEYLNAQTELNQSANGIADTARRRVLSEAEVERLTLNDRERKHDITAAEADQLRLLNQQTRDQRLRNISAQETDAMARERLSISQADLRTEEEITRLREQMAGTAQERQASQLHLLELSQRQERAELDAVIASQTASDAQKEIAGRRLAALNITGALQREQIGRDNEGPMARYMRELQASTADVQRNVEGIQVRAFDSLAEAISGVVSGTESLGDAFRNMARGIVQDIIQMTVRMLIFRAISGLFGGGASAGSNVGMQGILFGGARASGGPVNAGMAYRVGERGEELFVPPSNGKIIPNNQLRAANNNGPVEIVIGFGPAPEFAPYVHQVSAGYAQEAVKVSVNHTDSTVRGAMRPKLNGTRR
ncbi:MAG: phage tail length tape measure family protein [Cypionkella sp.]